MKHDKPTSLPGRPAADACDLLDADHIAVKHLFVEYARLAVQQPESGAARAQIAGRICDELTVHAQIEEEVFYPALRKPLGQDADLLDEAREEHQQAKKLIARIRAARKPGADVDELVAELARAVEHHVKEERDEIFPKARSAAGLDLAALASQLSERRQALAGGEAKRATKR